jgi:hypothetical protein
VACQGLSRGTEKEKQDRGNVRIKMCTASLGEMLTLCYIKQSRQLANVEISNVHE